MVSKGMGIFFVVAVLILSSLLAVQVSAFDAPTNAKFEVTGDGNVNTHTGDMSLSIPLITLPGRGTDFPVTLSYGSGLKHNQKASTVGLGWSLNIPGITRSMSGIPDDYKASDDVNFFVHDKVNGYTDYITTGTEVKKDSLELGMVIGNLALQFAGTFFMPPLPASAPAPAPGDPKSGLSQNAGFSMFLSTANTLNTIAAYEGQSVLTHSIEIDTIPDEYGEPHKQQGFYYIGTGLQPVAGWQELIDFTSPDIFQLSSPAYSGPIIYGENTIDGHPKVFHAQVASSNIHDVLDDTDSQCDNDNQDAVCSDALQIVAYQEQVAGEYNGLIKKFKVTDINGNEYIYEPIGKIIPDGSVSVLQAEGKIHGGPTGVTTFGQFSQKTKAPSQGADLDGDCNFNENGNYMEILLLQPFYTSWGIKEINPASGSGFNKIKFYYGYTGTEGDWSPTYSDSPARSRRCVISPDGTTSYSETHSKFKILKYIDSNTYISDIETPIYRLHFIYDKTTRKDQREIRSGTTRMPYLTKIVLTRGNVAYSESGTYTVDQILQQVVFNQDYDLVSGTPDNFDAAPNDGRLTLNSIQTFGKGGIQATPVTSFEYHEMPYGTTVLPVGYWGDVGGVELLAEDNWYKYENGDLAEVRVTNEEDYVETGQMGLKIEDGTTFHDIILENNMCWQTGDGGLKCSDLAATRYCIDGLGYGSYVTGSKVCDTIQHEYGNWADGNNPLMDNCGLSPPHEWIETMQCQENATAAVLQLVDGVSGYDSIDLNFKAKKISGDGTIRAFIKYYDASKTYLGYDDVEEFTITDSWQTYQVSDTVHSYASYALVLIHSSSEAINDVAIDNVELTINGGANILGYPGFEYPPMNPNAFDRWGSYFEPGTPFTHNAEGNPDGLKPWANSLKKVTWSTGGTSEWKYEADRYLHVGNYYASQVGNQIEKDDTHYGGGLRVSEVENCDGLDNCYSTKYVYTNDINDLVNGEQDYIGVIGGPGESSGVATYEPPAYDGIDDSYFMTTGTPYANAYVGYEHIFEIPSYNENGANLQEMAPYGWTKYEYTTARTNPDLGSGHEPPIIFNHPDQVERKYGFSLKRSHEIDYGGNPDFRDAIDNADRLAVLPIGEPIIVYGPPGANLNFVFKVGYWNPGGDHDDTISGSVCVKNVVIPYSNDCNTLDIPESEALSCAQVVFEECNTQDWTISYVKDHILDDMICGACDSDYNTCEWCGAVYDVSVNPELGEAPLYKFVWARDAYFTCDAHAADLGLQNCKIGNGETWAVHEAFYRYNAYEAGTQIDLYSFPNTNSQLPTFQVYRPPEYKSLKCLDGNNDNTCDYFQTPGITTQQRYSGTQNMDYQRGSLISAKSYKNDGALISSSENLYQYGRAYMQAYSNDGFSLPPIYWNALQQSTQSIDNTETTSMYDYNNINGQINYKETHFKNINNDEFTVIETTKFGGLNYVPHVQDYASEHLYRDMRWDHSWNNIILNIVNDGALNALTKSMTQWQMKGSAFYPKVNFIGGNFIEGAENEMIKVSQKRYNDYGQLRIKKDYIKSSFNFDDLLTDTTNSHYTYTLYGYGDTTTPCGGIPHEANYGWQGGTDFGNFYLTCVYNCEDVENGPEGDEYACYDWQKSYVNYNDVGQITDIIDENDQTASFEYDDLWRLWKSYQPGDPSDRPTTIYEYTYALDQGDLNYDNTFSNMNMNQVTTRSTFGNDEYDMITHDFVDGLGRPWLSTFIEDDTHTLTETKYNEIGLVEQTSNPYKLGEDQDYWTRIFYENSPLTRANKAYNFNEYPSGTYTETYYTGTPDYHYTRIKNENDVSVISTSDKLGNVVETNVNNIVLNPSFELGGDYHWVEDVWHEKWWCDEQHGGTYSITSDYPKYGDRSLKQVSTYENDPCRSVDIPIDTGGGTYTICADFKKISGTGDNSILQIMWDGASYTNAFHGPVSTSWERKCGTRVVPAGVNEIYVRLFNNYNSGGTHDATVVVDGIQLYKGPLQNKNNQFISTITEFDILSRPILIDTTASNSENSIKTQNVYDTLGRIRATKNPDFGVRRNLKYDARSNVIVSGDGCEWDSGGYDDNNPDSHNCQRKVGVVYDGLNRLICVDYDISSANSWNGLLSDCSDAEIKYHYDDYDGAPTHCQTNFQWGFYTGKLTYIENTYGTDYKACYSYDYRGRLREDYKEIHGEPFWGVERDYNNLNSIVNLRYPFMEAKIYHFYDEVGRLESIFPVNGFPEVPQEIVDYEYDNAGRLVFTQHADGPKTTYTYTPRNWIEQIRTRYINTEIPGDYREIKEVYDYDNVGNLLNLHENEILTNDPGNPVLDQYTDFSYDNVNRLTQTAPETASGRYYQTIDYTYDENDNMLTRTPHNTFTVDDNSNKLDRLNHPAGQIDYVYDSYGNLQSKSGNQFIELGLADTGAGEQGDTTQDYWIYGIDANVDDVIKIAYYAKDAPGGEPANGVTYVWQTPVQAYTGQKSPYWDGGEPYETYVKLTDANNIYGSPASSWYNQNHVQQYFHTSREKATEYYFDAANRLTHWIDSDGNCNVFEYDDTGNRIIKIENRELADRAVDFERTGYIDIGDTDGINDIEFPFTIEAWVMLPLDEGGMDIYFNPIFTSDDHDMTVGTCGFWLTVGEQQHPDRNGRVHVHYGDCGEVTRGCWSINTIPAGVWTHVAAVVEGGYESQIRLYINGQPASEKRCSGHSTGEMVHSEYPAVIGKNAIYNPDQNFKGQMDELRIWNEARTQQEIYDNMDIGVDPSEEPTLKAYWKFNEGTGTIANDAAGDNDGEIQTGVSWIDGVMQGLGDTNGGYATFYITEGGNTIYEKYYTVPDFTCPESRGGAPEPEIKTEETLTTQPVIPDISKTVNNVGNALGKFLLPFVG
ncbi:LamG-like jellyroll fold domain-containing protein [Candidatus Aenigmatarchaeota archaeon]